MEKTENASIRIILVDDEEDLVTFLAHRLLRRGYMVTATTSGPEAIAAAAKNRFDVAILDLKMPHMDGIEVLEVLKASQPFLQVIMLTGHGSHDSALKAGRLQAFRYLIKPYDYDELIALLHEAYENKVSTMKERFNLELAKVMSGGMSPRELRLACQQLRERYEQ